MPRSAEKPRIVMVDDDVDFQGIVRGWLDQRYELVALSRGDDLIAPLGELDPRLIMLDVRMPGPDGFEVCRRLRRDPRFADTPILFLTACKEDSDFLASLDAGGSAFLTKPVGRQELLAMVGELLGPGVA